MIGAANLTLHTLIDEEHGARGIKVKWDTTTETRLEDCFDFGRYFVTKRLGQVFETLHIKLISG